MTNRTLRGLSGFTQVIPTRYEYDSMNRLTLVTNSLAAASYGYTDGRLTSKVYSNGDTVSYGYDLESRLTNLTIQSGTLTRLRGFDLPESFFAIATHSDSDRALPVTADFSL